MKITILIVTLTACLGCLTRAEVPSDTEIMQRLSELNAKRNFEASEALLLDFLKKKPAAANVAYLYLHELKDKYDADDRVIALASKLLPGIEKNAPEYSAHVLHLRATSILYGPYRLSRERKLLNQAKNDLILAITYNENLMNAHINLGILYGIDGNIERAKLHFQRSIDTATVSDPKTAEMVEILRRFLSMANERPKDFVEWAKHFYLSKTDQSKQ